MPEDFSIKGFRPQDLGIGGVNGAEGAGKINEVKGPDKQEKGDEAKFGVAQQGVSEDNMQEVDISAEDFDNMDFEDFDGMSANVTAQDNTNVNETSNSPANGDNMNFFRKDLT